MSFNIHVSPSKKMRLDGEGLSEFKGMVQAFHRGSGHGLLYLDVADHAFTEEYPFAYWKDFVRLYLAHFAALPDLDHRDLNQDPVRLDLPEDDLNRLLLTVPPMKGAEYVDRECLHSLWREIEDALREEILEFGKDIPSFFAARHSQWGLLGRVCFHLAENKTTPDTPFAFLATYAHQISQEGKTRYLPLSRALEEYSGSRQKQVLLRLLAPLHKASLQSEFIKTCIDSGEIYHPLAWMPNETYRFLKDIPIYEKSGIIVKVPNWWKPKQPNRPQIEIRVGEKAPQGMGFEALLDFSMSVVLGGEKLNEKEIQDLLSRSEQLIFFKGQWIEVDREKLDGLLAQWKSVARQVKAEGVTFAEGLRWMAGISGSETESGLFDPQQSVTRVISGQWLETALNQIKAPEASGEFEEVLNEKLKTKLRPYQSQGVAWLSLLNQLRLGGILADDMGLGKTVQLIALLLLKKQRAQESSSSALLIVPASLLGNWQQEIAKFAPSLRFWIAHPSGQGTQEPCQPVDFDLAITTYGSVSRLAWLGQWQWDLVVLDEAQAIKNPSAKQAKAVKCLKSNHRLALTGTPVENHLADLWSLFDFLSPGLLGSAKAFERFFKKSSKKADNPYAALRTLVRPYILRRLKTDKKVIDDLPEKTELKAYCQLTPAQVALYQKSVEALAREIENADGIRRRGIILSYLMRFKQICNHPSQWVKKSEFPGAESGKFMRLKEICDVIADKQEKALIFTQFKEMTAPLSEYLASVFSHPGLALHGETPVKKRVEMVSKFQSEDGPPFFVLSLKAGGTGLNLTSASHVIHFDRWWNPAVENQATDRAFRIGQKKNVLVHKFICRGTLEEKIDMLIESKQNMSREILEGADAALLTELPNEELLKIVSLDLNSAAGEN